ncbi:MAG: hypothetical protein H6907_06885 [Hyphomicrobiales bacterium]|nr:hypothetical protein [Hyphomicrobiales bacterium]
MKRSRQRLCRYALVFAGLAAVSGCASPARESAMVVDVAPQHVIAEDSSLLQSVDLQGVSGGESTNPLWTSEIGNPEFEKALRNSLANHAMLAKGDGRFVLVATLQKVDQPFFGASMTVTATVRYVVTERATSEVYFDETITRPYTAKFSDSFLGVERLRLANEGAARVNIEAFIDGVIARSKRPDGASSGLAPWPGLSIAQIEVR